MTIQPRMKARIFEVKPERPLLAVYYMDRSTIPENERMAAKLRDAGIKVLEPADFSDTVEFAMREGATGMISANTVSHRIEMFLNDFAGRYVEDSQPQPTVAGTSPSGQQNASTKQSGFTHMTPEQRGRCIAAAKAKRKKNDELITEIAPIVFDLRAKGKTWNQVASSLNRRGYKTVTGGRFNQMGLSGTFSEGQSDAERAALLGSLKAKYASDLRAV